MLNHTSGSIRFGDDDVKANYDLNSIHCIDTEVKHKHATHIESTGACTNTRDTRLKLVNKNEKQKKIKKIAKLYQ